jgi:UPF0755 protein
MFKKKFLLIALFSALLLAIIAGGAFLYFRQIFLASNVFISDSDKVFVYISDKISTTDEVLELISEQVEIKNRQSLEKAINMLQYTTVRSGRYELRNKMNNKDLVRMLQRGLQTPVRVTFNNIRTKEELAATLSRQLMSDSASIMALLTDEEYLAEFGFNRYTVVANFIPNTYEFFWNTTAERMFERFNREYRQFWTEERLAKAAAIPLTPIEVSILASIVEAECSVADEYARVAGLYINRLRRGMRLEADPTVIFAHNDFTIRRVLFRHLEIDSPFNTYKNAGLPPGPIRIPSIRGIDAVLNYERHNYIFMTANADFSGRHAFAVTHAEHSRNAAAWHRALNERRIFR